MIVISIGLLLPFNDNSIDLKVFKLCVVCGREWYIASVTNSVSNLVHRVLLLLQGIRIPSMRASHYEVFYSNPIAVCICERTDCVKSHEDVQMDFSWLSMEEQHVTWTDESTCMIDGDKVPIQFGVMCALLSTSSLYHCSPHFPGITSKYGIKPYVFDLCRVKASDFSLFQRQSNTSLSLCFTVI